MPVPAKHEVLGTPLRGPFPDGVETAIFGMGCFWGAERLFWQADGVYTTAVGYAAAPPRTPPTRRSAAGAPATRRPCSSPSTLRDELRARC